MNVLLFIDLALFTPSEHFNAFKVNEASFLAMHLFKSSHASITLSSSHVCFLLDFKLIPDLIIHKNLSGSRKPVKLLYEKQKQEPLESPFTAPLYDRYNHTCSPVPGKSLSPSATPAGLCPFGWTRQAVDAAMSSAVSPPYDESYQHIYLCCVGDDTELFRRSE